MSLQCLQVPTCSYITRAVTVFETYSALNRKKAIKLPIPDCFFTIFWFHFSPREEPVTEKVTEPHIPGMMVAIQCWDRIANCDLKAPKISSFYFFWTRKIWKQSFLCPLTSSPHTVLCLHYVLTKPHLSAKIHTAIMKNNILLASIRQFLKRIILLLDL